MKSSEKTKAAKELKGSELLVHPELKELMKFAQVIPASMMRELKKVAAEKGISIELEIASRLLVTFVEPEALGSEPLSQKILNQQFSLEEVIRECELNHERWLYPYELRKLELFLEFQGKLPRRFKENFTHIDVKKESKRILEAIQKRKKNTDEE